METVEGRCRWRTERLRAASVMAGFVGAEFSGSLFEGCGLFVG